MPSVSTTRSTVTPRVLLWRASLVGVVVGLLALAVVGVTAAAPPATPGPTDCTVAAAGDIAGADDLDQARATGKLVAGADPVAFVALGDEDYDSGKLANYDQAYGMVKDITIPVRGNHEDLAGFDGYFGSPAPQAAKMVCGWDVVSIDLYAGVEAGAKFITEEAARHIGVPMMVAWHEPRWSSGSEHGSNPAMQPLWQA